MKNLNFVSKLVIFSSKYLQPLHCKINKFEYSIFQVACTPISGTNLGWYSYRTRSIETSVQSQRVITFFDIFSWGCLSSFIFSEPYFYPLASLNLDAFFPFCYFTVGRIIKCVASVICHKNSVLASEKWLSLKLKHYPLLLMSWIWVAQKDWP